MKEKKDLIKTMNEFNAHKDNDENETDNLTETVNKMLVRFTEDDENEP